MPQPTLSHNAVRSNTIGLFIGTFFGLLWLIGGAIALGGLASIVLIGIGVAIAAYSFVVGALVLRCIRDGPPSNNGANPFTSPIYRFSVLIEIIGIPVAARLLNAQGLPQYLTPAISLIVGLHMFGIAVILRQRSLMFIGGAMCVLALFTVLVLPASVIVGDPPHKINVWPIVVGLGNGVLFLLGYMLGVTQLQRATARAAL